MALLEFSWMAEFFAELSLVRLKKSSSCSSKFLNNFIKILCGIMDVIQYTARYKIQYVGHWVALLNSVLRIGIAVKCVHISGRG